MKPFKIGYFATFFVVGMSSISIALSAQINSLQVHVTPANPRLGETLAVAIELDPSIGARATTNNPTVTFDKKTYPTFSIAPYQYRVLLPTTPLEQPGRKQVEVTAAGQVRHLLVQVRNRYFPVQHITLSPAKASLEATKYEQKRVAAFEQLETPQQFWDAPFKRPNQGAVTTVYGVRRYYNGEFAKDYFHAGIDYAGAEGSPVIAPAAGRVALAGRESQGFRVHGNCIGIDHGQGVVSIFMHLSQIEVKEGDMVRAGQVIGAVGSTGAATGPHLHWGLYVQGQAVDPVPWQSRKFN